VTLFLDTNPSQQSNGNPTPAKSCESEQPMDGSPVCECMKEMCDCSIHPSTKEKYLASMQASHARILASPEVRQVLQQVRGLDFTGKFSGLPMKYDLVSSSWKMSQQSLLEPMEDGSEQSLATLPSAALMRSGVVWQLPKLELNTSATGGGSWPTPTRHNAIETGSASQMQRNTVQLGDLVASAAMSSTTNCSENTDARTVKGRLNPKFVEWLMIWPIGWTFTTGFKKKRKSGARQQKQKTEPKD